MSYIKTIKSFLCTIQLRGMFSILKVLQADYHIFIKYIYNYCRYFFSSHRQARLKAIPLIEPISSPLDTRCFHLCMRDVFILSRNYDGSLHIFLETIRDLRTIISISQTRPSSAQICKQLSDTLHNAQKKLVYASSKFEGLVEYYSKDLRLSTIAQAVKADCYRIFDYCNTLIRKLNKLEQSFPTNTKV